MTEPVAYWHIPQLENEEVFVDFNQSENSNFEDIPLYTLEDLHPRVKMTQAEFDEFHSLLSLGIDTPYEALSTIIDDRGEMDEFEHLYNRLFTHDRVEQSKNQSDFSTLWSGLLGRNVKELVEIVPNMKWFVVAKEANKRSGNYNTIFSLDISDTNGIYREVSYDQIGRYAYQFDTKEEAELWKNPLTEAVLLPVEEN